MRVLIRFDPWPGPPDLVPTLSQLASWSGITEVVSSHSPGIPLRRLAPEGDGFERFATLTTGLAARIWRGIVREKTLVFYLPPHRAPPDVVVELDLPETVVTT